MGSWFGSLPHGGFENDAARSRWESSERGFLSAMTEAISGARRANSFLDWVMNRPEKRIAVVTHSRMMHECFVPGSVPAHAEVDQQFDFELKILRLKHNIFCRFERF